MQLILIIIKYMSNILSNSVRRYMICCICLLALFSLSSCKTSQKTSSSAGSPHVENIHVGRGNKMQKKVIEEAYSWIGTPYKYGGVEKGEGVDCSGMVMMVYESVAGEKLPRNSAKQAEFCNEISAEEVDMGDLVFFATGKDPDKVSHVGIVIDNDSFIHASSSKGVVVSQLSSAYYQRTFRMFGRIPNRHDLISENK